MLGMRPLRKAFGPSAAIICWTQSLMVRPALQVTRERTVSMGWVRAVPHMEAMEPPSMRCQALMSIVSSELCEMMAALKRSKTKNSTALVGAMRATLSEFPLKSPMGPSVRAILARVPKKPSCFALRELIIYSIFTLSRGATTDLETPPETAPAKRCLATFFPGLLTTSPFIFMYRPLDMGMLTSTSPRSRQARPHTSKTSRMSLALVSSMKSRNSAKSIALPAVLNSSFDSPSNPPPLEKGPLPVLMRLSMERTSLLLMSL
mmetsp:Transcript_9669/g.24775  ORF Transcript_9669/g.24775 Transcript_9669/m.24775 type:complete len:262 (-) Transcript_9669:67-852(-)